PAFAALPLLGRRAGAALVVPGLDPEATRSLAEEFLREMRLAAEALGGAEAAEAEAVVAAAHRLAGAAATLGATRLATAARQLQGTLRQLPPDAAEALRAAVLEVADETVALLEASRTPVPDRRTDIAAL
ncbi:Hpt domain-containing protein, partial [Paracraurococcus ruber]